MHTKALQTAPERAGHPPAELCHRRADLLNQLYHSSAFPFFFISRDTVNHTEFSVIEILREESKLSSLQARKKRRQLLLTALSQLLFHYLPCFFTLQTAQRLGAWAKPSPFVPCSHRCIFKGKLIPRNAVHAHTYLGSAPTPAHQVTQCPLALAATFQPAELLLTNCYLSNR